jgi:hypothetical protein
MKIEFCCKDKCPVVEYTDESNLVLLGDSDGPEGISIWSKEQFADFIKAAKMGKFDEVIKSK